ncbi:MAG: DNA helicase PcrA [Clostridium sp.]|nr:DNA helicase PcrA [Clostridium sp.]
MNKYDTLNPMQKEAVYHTEGPLLVLAGAGSGKTRVLTHRIAYLIEEKGVNPWNIMAITFTNKAAAEMRERVDKIVGFGSESIWVSTFHSSCVRILRRHIEYLGYSTSFTIYDGDDQKTLMKQIFKKLDIDTKQFKERAVLGKISSAKDEMITPEEYELNAGGDFREKKIAQIYKEYQKELKKNNALDFDDLILKTVELFQNVPEVLNYYQERFRYIMVDEYQDTNLVQFKLVDLLAKKYRNLCVVGDDDQSIYKFRGANIENILSFEKAFPGARVIKLEQNYRSTQNILNAANEVIRNNRGRKDKTLWTANEEGTPVRFLQFDTAYEEAEAIAREIRDKSALEQRSYSDFAVLYRTNAQSRLLEEKFILYSIPYRLVGGVNFYQRKEIKDILCYLKTIANGQDDLAVQRIINVPKRGIGATSIGKVTIFASANGMSFYQALLRVKAVPAIGKAGDKIGVFTEQIEDFKSRLPELSIKELIEEILEKTGYKKELEAEGEIEAETRLQNIEELINKAVSYSESAEEPTLNGFLEEVALVADVDNMDESENRVILMTLHSAKGLEFPYVYLSGMEDGLFPSSMSIMSDDKDAVEEERRLCYVGITRAQKELTLTAARQRMTNGETRFSKVSRFVEEIPEWLLEKPEQKSMFGRAAGLSFGSSGNRGEAQATSGGWNRKAGMSSGWGTSGNDSVSGSGSSWRGASEGFGSLGTRKNAYASKTTPSPSPSFGKSFTVQKAARLDYREGDRVRHIKFGEGTVTSIVDGGKDFEVTVNFDRVGQKKMFASFARLTKL